MPISISNLVFASQLFILVAEGVPNYDIARGCRIEGSEASLGLDITTKECLRQERSARDQLQAQWSQFAPADRAMCTADARITGDTPPSYVDLLTCLQEQVFVKKLEK
jgi:hypothetical protein